MKFFRISGFNENIINRDLFYVWKNNRVVLNALH